MALFSAAIDPLNTGTNILELEAVCLWVHFPRIIFRLNKGDKRLPVVISHESNLRNEMIS